MKETILFLIDDTVLSGMIDNKNKKENSEKMLTMLLDMKEKKVPFKAVAHVGSLLRTLWLAEDIDQDNLKKLFELIIFFPTPNFKDKDTMVTEVIKLANLFGAKKQSNVVNAS